MSSFLDGLNVTKTQKPDDAQLESLFIFQLWVWCNYVHQGPGNSTT